MAAALQKVFFRQQKEGFETESLWCTKDGDHFVIDNIPFIAKGISLGDIIKVEYDVDEQIYYFDYFVTFSGNSTVRIIFDDHSIASLKYFYKLINSFLY